MKVELAALVVAALAAWAVRAGRPISDRTMIAALAALGLVLAASLTWLLGVPLPRIHDEWSYLLAADTFASGRLTNPAPPAWPTFETFHVLVQPTYMSKYPPAQGLVLALGQRFAGEPIVGVWLSMALLGGSLAWCLVAFVERPWAAAVTALYLVRLSTNDYIGYVGYWAHSYWGGALAAAGGALVLGAIKRLDDKLTTRSGVCLAVGLGILANSRPLEGFCMALPLLLILALPLWRRTSKRRSLRSLAPGLAILVAVFVCMVHYNARVTGHPLRLPYAEYDAQYASAPTMVFAGSRFPDYHVQVMAEFYRGIREIWMQNRTLAGLGRLLAEKVSFAWSFYLGVAWTAVLIALPRLFAQRWARVCLMSMGATFAVYAACNFTQAHYLAPLTAPLVVILALAVRECAARFGTEVVVGILACVSVAASAEQLATAASRPEPSGGYAAEREKREGELIARGGKHLVLVRYEAGHSAGVELVYNRADIESAPVVWARDLGLGRTRELHGAFPERHVWLLDTATDVLEPHVLPPSLSGEDPGVAAAPGGSAP